MYIIDPLTGYTIMGTHAGMYTVEFLDALQEYMDKHESLYYLGNNDKNSSRFSKNVAGPRVRNIREHDFTGRLDQRGSFTLRFEWVLPSGKADVGCAVTGNIDPETGEVDKYLRLYFWTMEAIKPTN